MKWIFSYKMVIDSVSIFVSIVGHAEFGYNTIDAGRGLWINTIVFDLPDTTTVYMSKFDLDIWANITS